MNLPRVSTRPRVEGDREQEILEATLDVLAEVGYDRLTMDAVAKEAQASKATLYRRWETKARLVIDALACMKGPTSSVDTGSLRGDLIETFCGAHGLNDQSLVRTFASVITALGRDAEFAAAFRETFVREKIAATAPIWDRAAARGDLRPGLDMSLIAPALAGIVLHRVLLLGETPTQELITALIDQIIIPAATYPAPVLTNTKEA